MADKQKSIFGKSCQIVKVWENISDNESFNSFSFQVIIMPYILSAKWTIGMGLLFAKVLRQ